MKIDGIEVTIKDAQGISEILRYIKFLRERLHDPLKSLVISMADDGRIALDYTTQGQRFERIRRITGYIVGSTDRWNSAKRAEERDRVKHD